MSLAALLKMGMEKAKFVHDVAGVVPSTLVDISEGGIFLTVAAGSDDLHMQDGTNIEVKFDLDGREVTLKGTVVRGGQEEKGYAVEFYDSEPRDRQAVKRFIRKSIEKRKEMREEEEKDSSG
jgi:c-di-GMP-binding flagellar brake protein YcgR